MPHKLYLLTDLLTVCSVMVYSSVQPVITWKSQTMKMKSVDLFNLSSPSSLQSQFIYFEYLKLLHYLTKVSTPLTFQQKCWYNFSMDNTAQMKLGYILEQSMCSLYRSTNVLSSKYISTYSDYCPNNWQQKWVHPKWSCQNCPKCQHFVGALLLSSTALILLGMKFTRAAQVVDKFWGCPTCAQ